jgi:3-methyladenine DNA glycosylase AlkD
MAVTATAARVGEALAWLERQGSPRVRKEMLTRYGITAPKAFGVPMGAIQQLAKGLGRDHDLAGALWATGWYEARMLAALVDEPEQVTAAQMDRWVRDFDNWGICDTVCFKLFDRAPHAWRKVAPWSRRRDEFVRRAAFALLASLALHDKATGDEPFLRSLGLIERGASDERNFVKKGVSWALRAVGRRNRALNAAALEVARRLAERPEPAPRWVGKDALRELAGAVVRRQLAARRSGRKG